jgi:uncharacterized protein YyaL (SSP411 family)
MPNRLAAETSPYLRQHAGNPVDWWPWCDGALATARRENKPILLSIGYAACHWCHVMAHESFEDAATAGVMNALYVNVKVDREERPDIDKVYQLAHQALAQRGGGWPLTMFLTPDDLLPFFAGTYFPNAPRYGMPAFVQVLQGVRAWFDGKPGEVRAQNGALARFLANHAGTAAHADVLDDAPIHHALERISGHFDADNGGHRGGPKFPHASEIELLLTLGAPSDEKPSPGRPGERRDPAPSARDDHAEAGHPNADPDPPCSPANEGQDPGSRLSPGRRQEDPDAHAAMARLTLARMAGRGLADHLGGGFFRYCVDERWEIPHFEKMLYDNAALLPLYARAAMELDESAFADAARACADWLARDLQAAGGGFMSSYDADSEGEEGRYYVWQRDEVRALLAADEFAIVEPHYGLDDAPNFEGRAWHLVVKTPLADVAARLGLGIVAARQRLADARAKLLAARARRVRPGLDDKILTAWNALLIAGIARAARALPDRPLLAEAERAVDVLHAKVWKHGRLYACYAGGETKFPAYLDDHAFLLDALLALLQVRWKRRDLDWAIALADTLLERFEDRAHGGFFFTAHDAEPLPQRPKPWMDESLPSGNGVAARALLKLGHLLGETRYLEAAERTLRAAWPLLGEYPQACCTLLLALDEFLQPPSHLVVRHHGAADAWRTAVRNARAQRLDAYFIPADTALPGALAAMTTNAGATAWLCRALACGAPITEPGELERALSARG